jgi:double-stranded uracil-DNA glycosylase
MKSFIQSASPNLAYGFPALENPDARGLILGSMPGIASLRAGQYYAHPRNQFWPIMSELLALDLVGMAYPLRLRALSDSGFALWDVLQSCRRRGSLDADIAADSLVVNDFTDFFRRHLAITHIFFNGAAAEQLFRRHVRPPACICRRLPSTSPAHASLDFPAKLEAWRSVLECAQMQTRSNFAPRHSANKGMP